MKNIKVVFFFLILVPVILIFKKFLIPGPLASGDAPYFYPEGLAELISTPVAWTQRGINFGGPNLFLWIWPLLFLYGVAGSALNFGNDIAIRLIFYFPSLVLCLTAPFYLAKYLKLPKTVWFFASLVFVLNTYYILLIDGGQVGVALAYGLFPLCLLFLKKLFEGPSLKGFVVSTAISYLTVLADPRVGVVCFLTLFVWVIVEMVSEKNIRRIKNLSFILLEAIFLGGLNAYWILPLIRGSVSLNSGVSDLNLISILNPLLLFQPHFPGNEFGKVVPPPFYFVLIPFLVFGSLLFRKEKRGYIFAFLFLVFAFLSKGSTFPLGQIYNLVISLPFGFAFRDSSKFFAPLILFGGILIGLTVDSIKPRIFKASLYILILALVYPAILGKLNFVLSDKSYSDDFNKIYNHLREESKFARTLWISERHPLAYEVKNLPVLEGKDLVNTRPIASLNAGEDVFNFLNNPVFVQWLKIFGTKYVIASGNPRNITPTEKDIESWDTILKLLNGTPGLERLNWGTSFPVYKISGSFPRFYSVSKLVAVVGSDQISSGPIFSPSIYFEDGKLDPELLKDKDPGSLEIFFNGKDRLDLAMSYLQKYFISPGENTLSSWAVYKPDRYLKYKYELLIRGVDYRDFDYGRGIAFSTQAGEKINFKFNVKKEGDYIVAVRRMVNGSFKWEVEEKKMKVGDFDYQIENRRNPDVLNVVAVIPKRDFDEALRKADLLVSKFKVIGKEDISKETVGYKFDALNAGYWLIFNDSYNSMWKLSGDKATDPVPVFSAINGFYVAPGKDAELIYNAQRSLESGIYISLISFFGIGGLFLWSFLRK